MKDMNALVVEVREDLVVVQADDYELYSFPLPQPLPAAGERVRVVVEDGGAQRLIRVGKGLASKEYIRSLYKSVKSEAPRAAHPDAVDEGCTRQYEEHGFLIVEDVFNAEEISVAFAELDRIVDGTIAGPQVEWRNKPGADAPLPEKYRAVRKIQSFVDYSEPLRGLAHHPNIAKTAEKLLRDRPLLSGNMAMLKPPSEAAGVEKPWHQDMAYGPYAYSRMVCGVWIALDDADIDNGCMHVIPGSHRAGPVPHYAVRDWQLCDANVNIDRSEAVPLRAGSALFFSGLLHHGTPPNDSSRNRRALQFHYRPESAEKLGPKEYKRMFTNELTQVEC